MKYPEIIEGLARIRAPHGAISKKLPVFYNPAMKLNRDISVRLLNALQKKDLKIALPLAGTGIRGIRFAKELDEDIISELYLNDISIDAYRLIKKNIALNNAVKNIEKINLSCNEANKFLLDSKGLDYIDIDPFGTPNPYMDSAIKRLLNDAILAVTATDTAPLCGSYPKACARKYWSSPKRDALMHETGLRILIRKIQLIAAQYDKALIPVMCYSVDHYFRTFFRCMRGKGKVDDVLSRHRFFDPKKHDFVQEPKGIDRKNLNAGPLWSGNLWDYQTIKRIDDRGLSKREYALVRTLKKEAYVESIIGPTMFYDIHSIYKNSNLGDVKKTEDIIGKLKEKNFSASPSHFSKYGIRTDARYDDIQKVL